MKRLSTKIGDIFSVNIDKNRRKYFQLIAFDLMQLNSDVIRVFKKSYKDDFNPDIEDIISAEVEFYAHCVTKLGIKLGYWEKYSHSNSIGDIKNIFFRISSDDPRKPLSENWWVWKINEERKYLGKLEGEHKLAEIGSVIPPDSIVYRIQTGKYDFVYPDFE